MIMKKVETAWETLQKKSWWDWITDRAKELEGHNELKSLLHYSKEKELS